MKHIILFIVLWLQVYAAMADCHSERSRELGMFRPERNNGYVWTLEMRAKGNQAVSPDVYGNLICFGAEGKRVKRFKVVGSFGGLKFGDNMHFKFLMGDHCSGIGTAYFSKGRLTKIDIVVERPWQNIPAYFEALNANH